MLLYLQLHLLSLLPYLLLLPLLLYLPLLGAFDASGNIKLEGNLGIPWYGPYGYDRITIPTAYITIQYNTAKGFDTCVLRGSAEVLVGNTTISGHLDGAAFGGMKDVYVNFGVVATLKNMVGVMTGMETEKSLSWFNGLSQGVPGASLGVVLATVPHQG